VYVFLFSNFRLPTVTLNFFFTLTIKKRDRSNPQESKMLRMDDPQEDWKANRDKYNDECSKIKPKLITLHDIEEGSQIPKFKDFQLFAICFPKRAPTKTRNVDYSASFLLIDPTIDHEIPLNAFRKNINDFPVLDPRGIKGSLILKGDVVSLKVMAKMFNGKIQLTASKTAPFVVVKEVPGCPQISPVCQILLELVQSEYRGENATVVARTTRRQLKISELQDFGDYFDFTGVVCCLY
jgi:hypothetical protein